MEFNFAALERSQSEDSDSSAESVHVPDRLRAARSRASGRSSEFASPRTAGSTDSAGSSTVGVSSDTPVRLVLVEDASQICGGLIGNQSNGHFCILPPDQCSAKSHKSTKAILPARPCWFVRTKRNGALLEIKCPESSIPSEEVREEMRTQERSPEVWRACFSSLGRELMVETGSEDGSVSELGSPSAADFTRAAEELITPCSVFVGRAVRSVTERAVDVPEVEPIASLGFDGVLPQDSDADQVLAVILAEWDKINMNFKSLRRMFVALGNEQDRLSEGVLQDFNVIGGKAKLVNSKIHLLNERIGHEPIASDGGIKTVWSAIKESNTKLQDLMDEFKNGRFVIDMLAKDLLKVQEDFLNDWPMHHDKLKELQEFHEVEFADFKSDYEESMGNLEAVLMKFDTRVSGLEGKSNVSSGRFSRLGVRSSVREGFVPEEEFFEVQQRVVFLEREVRELRSLADEVKELKDLMHSNPNRGDVEYLGTRTHGSSSAAQER